MEIVFYLIIIAMLAAYFILDGYDFGAGIVQLFFSRTEEEKVSVYRAVGPFWDANEVWLLAGGGTLFCSFPLVYASAFSGFYLPLMMVLWLLIFRGISIALREQVNNPLWRIVWDKAFGVSSLLLALFFGVALGNVIRGVNLGMVQNGVATQEGSFFFLSLWNDSFSPTDTFPGVLDWFTVIIGIIAVLTLAIHGANWVVYKTSSTLNARLRKAVPIMTIILIVFIILSLCLFPFVREDAFSNFAEYPFFIVLPVIALVGLIGLFGVSKYKKDGKGFFFSTLFIIGGLASSVVSIFPNLLTSTNTVNPSLTIYNASTDEYGLSTAVVWWSIAVVFVISYFVIQYRIFKGKIDNVDYH